MIAWGHEPAPPKPIDWATAAAICVVMGCAMHAYRTGQVKTFLISAAIGIAAMVLLYAAWGVVRIAWGMLLALGDDGPTKEEREDGHENH